MWKPEHLVETPRTQRLEDFQIVIDRLISAGTPYRLVLENAGIQCSLETYHGIRVAAQLEQAAREPMNGVEMPLDLIGLAGDGATSGVNPIAFKISVGGVLLIILASSSGEGVLWTIEQPYTVSQAVPRSSSSG